MLTLDETEHVRSAHPDASLGAMTSSDVGPTGIATMVQSLSLAGSQVLPSLFVSVTSLMRATVECQGSKLVSRGPKNTGLVPPRCWQRHLPVVGPHGTTENEQNMPRTGGSRASEICTATLDKCATSLRGSDLGLDPANHNTHGSKNSTGSD